MMKQILAAFLMVIIVSPVLKAAESGGAVGYTGYRIQLMPMMAPYMTSKGLRYEVLTVRLRLPEPEARILTGSSDAERPGCWMIPIIHEKILMYLNEANLTQADFRGQRREDLRKNLFDAVIRASDRSLYVDLDLVDGNSEPIEMTNDPRSTALTKQCR